MPVHIGENPRFLKYFGEINQQNVDSFAGTLSAAVAAGATDVHICFSSVGGQNEAGIALFQILRAIPVRTVAYNVSSLESAAVTAFVGATERFASTLSRFMIHPAECSANRLNSLQLRSLIEQVVAGEALIDTILRDRTSIPEAVLGQRRVSDVHFGPAQALTYGVVQGIEEFALPAGLAFP